MAKVFTITEGLENMGALRSGGQGSVYKARRTGTIITAVKILPTPIHTESEDDKNFKSFQNEVEKLKKVNLEPNPNVVKILSSGITESGSFPFIEMEFIEGPDLEDYLKPPYNKIFTLKEAIKLAEQLACALMHCHKAGVRHGDIKSNNVKFNQNTGNYVLLDFGLAVMSDEQRRSSLRNAGAIEFMAPEQNDGIMLFQTDIYSFGIILYELLAGEVPFPLSNNSETARNMVRLAHLETPVPDLLAKRRANLPALWSDERKEKEMQVPDWLLKMVYKCLEKKPEDRYADGMALQEAFGYFESAINDISLLAEIENLKTQLNEAKSHKTDLSGYIPLKNDYDNIGSIGDLFRLPLVPVPQKIARGILIVLLLLLVYSGYALFLAPKFASHQVQFDNPSNVNQPPANNGGEVDSNLVNQKAEEKFQHYVTAARIDSIRKDSLRKDKIRKRLHATKKPKKNSLRRIFDQLF
jgi:serine/threonine protein kinase